jgi:pteridine reductase
MTDETIPGRGDVAKNPVALVTGSGRKRLGHHVVQELARRGYRIAIHAHTSLDEAEGLREELAGQKVEAIVIQGDLSEANEIDRVVSETVEHFGQLDACVHTAAIWSPKTLEETTPEDVDKYYKINAFAPLWLGRAAGLAMARQATGGAIVLFGDWASARPYPDYSAYFLSKGTIPTITRTLATELAMRNPRIRVNAILPGPVMLSDEIPEDVREAVISATLVKRAGSPQNVAHAVAFLLENDYVTGHCLPIDGGRTIFQPADPRTS